MDLELQADVALDAPQVRFHAIVAMVYDPLPPLGPSPSFGRSPPPVALLPLIGWAGTAAGPDGDADSGLE
jgi:hypothetical protein